MRLPTEPDLPPQINIVPMIDVIFAVLTFFIMSTLFLTRSQGLPVNLPTASTSQQQNATQQVVITIDRQGGLALNRQPTDLNSLEGQIRQIVQAGQSPLVVINADEAVSHGQVVAVMDRVRAIEGVRLGIATQRP